MVDRETFYPKRMYLTPLKLWFSLFLVVLYPLLTCLDDRERIFQKQKKHDVDPQKLSRTRWEVGGGKCNQFGKLNGANDPKLSC